ncbi:MAG: hypothetical protein SGBAC_005240 [Bacillariaceae sp.]
MPPPKLRYSYISRSKNAKNSAKAFSIPVLLSTFVVALFVLNLLRMPSAYVEDNIELQQSGDSTSSGEGTPIDVVAVKRAAAAAAEVGVSSSTAIIIDEEEVDEKEVEEEAPVFPKPFEILCTTERRIATGGAYLIRCRDFERMVRHCTNDVNIALYTHNELVPKANVTYNASAAEIFTKQFDATVTIKFIIKPNPRFGRLFLDVVDRYKLVAEDLVEGMEVIVQNDYHGSDIYANKKYHVVEHWYNSFPEDMLASADIPGSFPLPEIKPIEEGTKMRMIIVWTNRIQPCPELTWDHSDVTLGCIHRKFRIETWYHMELPAFNATSPITYNETEMKRLEGLLADPDQGTGRIYYEIFWLFDVLVVPAKLESEEKLRYGNVQRAISQMRSGVPVLLEVYGDVLEDFMMRYNYTCAYTRPDITFKLPITRKFWSLDEATVAMKDATLRKQCQQEGLTIAKDYSPARLVERELRILGYQGKFSCP